jgi:hypothetical protein
VSDPFFVVYYPGNATDCEDDCVGIALMDS